MKVIDDKILVEVVQEKEKKVGIYLPDSVAKTLNQDKPLVGTVVEVGPGILGHVVMQVSKRDKVLFPASAGTRLTIGDKEYIHMRQGEVYMIL